MKHTPSTEAAFARPYSEQQPGDRVEPCYAQEGMTMREWFAGMALQGILAGQLAFRTDPPLQPADVAKAALNFADALLAEAKKGTRS